MTLQAGNVDPWGQRLREGLQFQQQTLFDQAESVYRGVLQEQPQHALAWHLLGIVKAHQGQAREALRCFQQSLLIWPEDPVAYHNLGNAFKELGCQEEALEASERAIARRPHYTAAWLNKAEALQVLGRHVQACAAYRQVLLLSPDEALALGGLAQSLAALCDWPELDAVRPRVLACVAAGLLPVSPFAMLWLSDDPLEHRRYAEQFAHRAESSLRAVPRLDADADAGAGADADADMDSRNESTRAPIRIAYLSADFHAHATALLMAQVFERHDRRRVRSYAYSFGQDSEDAMRQRLRSAFDEFLEVREYSDGDIVESLRANQIDVVVDLKGHTRGERFELFLRKPAPIAVNFLGYPGSMGHAAYDYIIGDEVVTPFDHADRYAEHIVQMPHCYQPNDSLRAMSTDVFTRTSEGLPESGFVFAAFNNTYKITPEVFDVWMRLLKAVPNSSLWFISECEGVARNLRQEAERRGVAGRRLVFSPRRPVDIHLARHRLADLFLDTLPINAHTTASDALWAGLPVLTCLGDSFAGRVAASLLQALDLPELITHNLQAYEALALDLARHPAKLQSLKDRLAQNKPHSPLFDAAAFARDLESAYEQMVAWHRQGLPPRQFSVSATRPLHTQQPIGTPIHVN